MQVGSIPKEVTNRPRANVAFCGLDLTIPEHSTIWEAFNENRGPERERLQFANFSLDHVFPRAKTKRTTYDGYVERGILKSNWLEKHLTLIPAVGVYIFDLDWDDAEFAQKTELCAEKVLQFQRNLSGRESRICLVLIQKRASSPVNDNKMADRAHELTKACGIPPKNLFVIEYNENLLGYIKKLEGAIMELAKSYYTAEYRRVGNQNQLLTKNVHQLVSIRHHFKMGTFQELRQETSVAVKHYKQAYGYLVELRVTDPNLLEVKTVAAIINYKICQLLFEQSIPVEAIHQLLKHVDNFKASVGPINLSFEHNAWLSKQFSLFGDLFEMAVRKGLSPIQIQHPGFYYSSAAQYALERKKAAKKYCQDARSLPDPDPLIGVESVPYYGQRPWRSALAKGEQPESSLEELAVKALQYYERQVNHSDIIIPLMSAAVSHFKKYKGSRIQKRQMVHLAEEYLANSEPEKALSILMHVDYKSERWPPILTKVYSTALRAAYSAANPPNYLTVAIEYMSSWTDCTPELRENLLTNVARILDGHIPTPPYPDIEEISALWQSKLATIKSEPVIVDMDKLHACISCQANFSAAAYSSDETIHLQVFVRSHLPLDVKFVSKFNVHFNHDIYDAQCSIADPRVLGLMAGKTHTFSFTFSSNQQHVGGQIKVVGISMVLGDTEWSGSPPKPLINLKWSSASLGSQHFNLAWQPIPNTKISLEKGAELPYRLSADIKHREARSKIEWSCEAPALRDEIFPVGLQFTNNEASDIGNVRATITVPTGTKLSTDPLSIEDKSSITIDLPPIRSGSTESLDIFVQSADEGFRLIEANLFYETSLSVAEEGKNVICKCFKQDSLNLEVRAAFTLKSCVLNKKLEPIPKIRCGETSMLSIDITCLDDLLHPIGLGGNRINMIPNIDAVGDEVSSQTDGIQLSPDETSRVCYLLNVGTPAESELRSIGDFTFQWRRPSYNHWNETSVALCSVVFYDCPVAFRYIGPAKAKVRTTVPVKYEILNKSADILEVSFQIDTSDAFMFSGSKQLSLRIPPRSKELLEYNLQPIQAGYVCLPTAHFRMNKSSSMEDFDSIVDETIPTYIFVLPQNGGLKSPV